MGTGPGSAVASFSTTTVLCTLLWQGNCKSYSKNLGVVNFIGSYLDTLRTLILLFKLQNESHYILSDLIFVLWNNFLGDEYKDSWSLKYLVKLILSMCMPSCSVPKVPKGDCGVLESSSGSQLLSLLD